MLISFKFLLVLHKESLKYSILLWCYGSKNGCFSFFSFFCFFGCWFPAVEQHHAKNLKLTRDFMLNSRGYSLLKKVFLCTVTNVKKMAIYCSALPKFTYKIWTFHGISYPSGHCIILLHNLSFSIYCPIMDICSMTWNPTHR